MVDNFHRICARSDSLSHRALLDLVDIGWYVETRKDKNGEVQGGNVSKVIRDKYGIPVCLQVPIESEHCEYSGRNKYDYISVDRVVFYEPTCEFPRDLSEYETYEETKAFVTGMGYVWDEEKECYVHPETGDWIVW